MAIKIQVTPVADTFGRLIVSTDGSSPLKRLGTKTLVDLFKTHSLLLLRGFDLDPDGFVRFTNRFDTDFMGYSGGAYQRDTIGGNKTLLSVTGGRQFFAVPFHGEMYYTKVRPTVMWFYCMNPPACDGETTLCDGAVVYRSLSPSTRKLFAAKRLKYIRSYDDGVWQGIYQANDLPGLQAVCKENDLQLAYNKADNSIVTEYVDSAVSRSLYRTEEVFVNNILTVIAQEEAGGTASLVRFEDGSKIPADVIKEIREVTDRCTLLVGWQKSDVVMFDNTQLMHGRRAFNDAQREIYVRMSKVKF
jgi:alpha-ketoglutarate-dependent taurine dioxygenase